MASQTFIEKAYLAYFGRPADTTGLLDFASATEAEVESAFAMSPESIALFGAEFTMTTINTIYHTLFGRDAEPDGLTYWYNRYLGTWATPEVPKLSATGVAMAILEAGLLTADQTPLENKLAASHLFTESLDTTAEILAYSGDAAAASARSFLTGITDTAATQADVNNAIAGLADDTAPVVTAAQTFTYAENQLSTATLGTVLATDNIAVTGFSLDAATTKAGLFAIDATGKITLTAAGIASTANDFDDTGSGAANTFTIGVTATDAAGHASAAVDVTLNVTNLDDIAPVLTGTVINGTRVVMTYDEALRSTGLSPSVTDFNVGIKGAAGTVAVTSVVMSGNTVVLNLGRAAAPGETLTLSYTPGANVIEDLAGNDAAALAARDLVADATAPVITAGQTFSYVELVAGVGTIKTTADVIGTVAATDANGIASFAITAGNDAGFFAINSKGAITLTAAGLAGAANDFEVLPNNFPLTVTATDGAGNVSTSQVVSITVSNNTSDDVVVPPGTPIQLTAAADNVSPASPVASTMTTANADVIRGTFDGIAVGNVSTLQLADGIDGGGGVDTFEATLTANALALFTSANIPVLNSIETLQLRTVGAAATLDFATITPNLLTLNFNNSTVDNTVKNVSKAVTTLGVSNVAADDVDASVTYTAGLTGASDALTVNVSNNTAATPAVAANYADLKVIGAAAGDGFDLVTVNSNGGNSRFDLFTVTDGAASTMKTLTINGSSNFRVNTALDFLNTTGTVDASNATGAVNLSFGAEDINAKGGTGNDRFAFGATNLTTADVINGGAGVNTVAIADAAISAATTDLNKAVNATSLIQVLEMTAAGAAVDASQITALKSFTFSGGGATAVTGTANTNTFEFTAAAGATTFAPLADTIADTLTLALTTSGAGFTVASVGAPLYETVALTVAAGSGTHTITALTLAANGTVNVVGGAAFTTTIVGTGAGINASTATGVQTLGGEAGNNSIKGGSANDVLSGFAGSDVIIGNGGNDTIAGGANFDDLTGSAGNDLFNYATTDAVVAAGNFTNVGAVDTSSAPGLGDLFTGVEAIRDLVGADSIDLDSGAAAAYTQVNALGGAALEFRLVFGQYAPGANLAAGVFTVGDGNIANGGDTDTLLIWDSTGAGTFEHVVLVGVNATEAAAIAQSTVGQLTNFGA